MTQSEGNSHREEAAKGPSLSQRVRELLRRTEYRVMRTQEDQEAIFKLRYDAYLREGAIERRESGKLTDDFDNSANSSMFGIYIDGLLAGSIRLHILHKNTPVSPALAAFPDHLQERVDQGYTIIDPNRFVVSQDAQREFAEMPYIVLKLPYSAADYFNAQLVTATVRREHQAFYKRVLLCKPVAPPRLYPTLIKPLSLMLADYPQVKEPIASRYPLFLSNEQEMKQLFGHLENPPPRTLYDHCNFRTKVIQRWNSVASTSRLTITHSSACRCLDSPSSGQRARIPVATSSYMGKRV